MLRVISAGWWGKIQYKDIVMTIWWYIDNMMMIWCHNGDATMTLWDLLYLRDLVQVVLAREHRFVVDHLPQDAANAPHVWIFYCTPKAWREFSLSKILVRISNEVTILTQGLAVTLGIEHHLRSPVPSCCHIPSKIPHDIKQNFCLNIKWYWHDRQIWVLELVLTSESRLLNLSFQFSAQKGGLTMCHQRIKLGNKAREVFEIFEIFGISQYSNYWDICCQIYCRNKHKQ